MNIVCRSLVSHIHPLKKKKSEVTVVYQKEGPKKSRLFFKIHSQQISASLQFSARLLK